MPRVSLTRATEEIAKRDRVMRGLIRQVGPYRPRPPFPDHFGALARAIVFQQLAGAAAMAIHGRFAALFPDGVTPAAVLAAPEELLRSVGLSRNKASSIRDLAAKVLDGTIPLERLSRMRDEEIIERLSHVRGIGRWTAEMFLLFQLRRLDVWPVDDLAVRKGYAVVHGLAEAPTPKELDALGELYRPYRSVAAWYCWRATDTVLPEG